MAAPRARAAPRPMVKPREPSGVRGAPRMTPANGQVGNQPHACEMKVNARMCMASTWVSLQCMCRHG